MIFFLNITWDNVSCSFSDRVQIASFPRTGCFMISDTESEATKSLDSLPLNNRDGNWLWLSEAVRDYNLLRQSHLHHLTPYSVLKFADMLLVSTYRLPLLECGREDFPAEWLNDVYVEIDLIERKYVTGNFIQNSHMRQITPITEKCSSWKGAQTCTWS